MKYKLLYITLFLCISAISLKAQNLVPNHSFEKAWTCPETFVTDPISSPYPSWFNPNKSTPDLLNACSVQGAGVPDNFAGSLFAYDGLAYAGIILRETFDDNVSASEGISREYIQTKLISKLKRNKLYCVKLQYANSSKSQYAVNALGVTITRDKIKAKSFEQILQRPQIINIPEHIMDNTDEWVEMCGTYRAKGNEEYITIGNFWSDKKTKFVKNNKPDTDSLFRYAYYYIDDVKVFEIENTFECGCVNDLSYGTDWLAENFDPETGYNSKSLINELIGESGSNDDESKNSNLDKNSKNDSEDANANNKNVADLNADGNKPSDISDFDDEETIKMKDSEITESAFDKATIGSSFNLNRIFFEFNSSELISISYVELDKLYDILASKSKLQIEIRGHTDIVGTAKYNKTLSIKRAEAVYEYLISKGIEKSRMKYRGFGNEVPLADNKTDEGRSQNRRVEIIIVDL